MTQILLAVIALGAIWAALYAVKETKEVIEELQIELGKMKIQLDQINKSDLVMHKADSKIFDILDEKIDRQARRISYLNQKHEHLYCVVMQKIQDDGEVEHENL